MIHFGHTHIIGFASIKDEVFNWDQKGLNIIQAPNGHGKTKFINALVWVLYGKTLNGSVETWDHLKGDDYNGTKVEQTLWVDGDEYKLIRCKDYSGKVEGATGKNRFILKVNGEYPKKVRDKKDFQSYLIEVIGYSFELFKNTIIFGQKLQRLISETGPNKKKVFDDAFEVTFIPKAKKTVEVKKQKLLLEAEKQKGIYAVLQSQIDSKIEALEQAEQVEISFEENKKENIKKEQEAIDKINKKLNGEDYKDLDERIIKLTLQAKGEKKKVLSQAEVLEKATKKEKENSKMGILVNENSKLTQENDRLIKSLSNLPESCERCKRAFTKHDHESERKRVKETIASNEKTIKLNVKQIEVHRGNKIELETQLSSAINIEKQYKTTTKELERLENLKEVREEYLEEIKTHESNINSIKAQSLKISTETLTYELRDLRLKAKPEKRKLKSLYSELKIYNWLIDDPLSNAGLKAFIFNQMLESINDRLDYYKQYIGFKVVFSIDLGSTRKDLETHVYQGKSLVPYSDLSGGQQQTVDIATAFAIHDVVSEGKECDLLIMDELFESLDKSNIEIITELIQDKSGGKCLFLVTHTDFSPTNANIIQVDFNNGITSLASC